MRARSFDIFAVAVNVGVDDSGCGAVRFGSPCKSRTGGGFGVRKPCLRLDGAGSHASGGWSPRTVPFDIRAAPVNVHLARSGFRTVRFGHRPASATLPERDSLLSPASADKAAQHPSQFADR